MNHSAYSTSYAGRQVPFFLIQSPLPKHNLLSLPSVRRYRSAGLIIKILANVLRICPSCRFLFSDIMAFFQSTKKRKHSKYKREMGRNVRNERSTRTHIKHAERWGYPNHILRQDTIGQGEWTVLVFGKLLYLQSIIVGELSRPTKERAEWIVYVTLHPTILYSHQHLHNLFGSRRTPSS